VRNAAALVEACRGASGATVLADLDSPRIGAVEAIRTLRADPAGASIPVIGFFSHVHAARAQDALAAGATRVLARSAFVKELPDIAAAVR
jgi:CheY-like chemotaxis protein